MTGGMLLKFTARSTTASLRERQLGNVQRLSRLAWALTRMALPCA